MLLADLATTSSALATTRSRLAKRALLVDLLRRTPPEDVGIVSRYLGGQLRQRRTGLGWRSLTSLPTPASEPSLTVAGVDAVFEQMSRLEGPGSVISTERAGGGAVRGGHRRRAAAPGRPGHRGAAAGVARRAAPGRRRGGRGGPAGGRAPRRDARGRHRAGRGRRADVTRPGQLRSRRSRSSSGGPCGRCWRSRRRTSTVRGRASGRVRWSSTRSSTASGSRCTAQGDDVRVFTRSLDDITARVPEIVAAVRAMPASDLVLDGEALAVGPDGRPRPFQETAARSATKDAEVAAVTTLTPFFFDALHVDGVDLLDAPLLRRLDALDAVAGPSVVHRLVTADVDEARDYFADVVRAGQEGVVIKAADAPYEAGRRGAAWIKVKPRQHPRPRRARGRAGLRAAAGDAVEHPPRGARRRRVRHARQDVQGHDRRDAGVADGAVHRAVDGRRRLGGDRAARAGGRDRVRRAAALDAVPRRVALRFARVLRYRDDKTAAEADTIDAVRALAGRP